MTKPATESRPAPPVYNPFSGAIARKALAPYRPVFRFHARPARTVQRSLMHHGEKVLFPGDIREEFEELADSQSSTPIPVGSTDIPEPKEHKEEARVRLGTVSLSSAIHHFEQINTKYSAVITQPWGFSFAKKSVQETDVGEINEYIDKWNAGEDLVKSHRAGEGRKILYDINGRTYSTHENSNQLYPISGPGIASGNGPIDMYHLLTELGRADASRIIKLSEQLASMDESYEKAAAQKKAGGHHSGVKIPKAKTTSAGNLKKKKQHELEAMKAEAEKALNKGKSGQYSNRLGEV